MKKFLNISKIVVVIIGTIIGAGFASGKEIYIFFGQYGKYGIIGAIVSSILTAIIVYSAILIAKKLKTCNNNEFLEQISENEKITPILKNIINIFLVVSFWIMNAGFCTFFKQEMGIPIIITAVLNALIVYILLMKDMDGIIKLNLIAVPIMVAIIIIISIKNYPIINLSSTNLNTESRSLAMAILNSILYTSYNSITLIPIIISLTSNVNDKKTYKITAIISGAIILILILAIYQMLTLCSINVKDIEIPILAILEECHPIEKTIYSIAIITAILTSALSSGYGFLENIKDKKKYKKIARVICILIIPISYIGFGNLVSILYPTFGLIGIIQIISILKKAIVLQKIPKTDINYMRKIN